MKKLSLIIITFCISAKSYSQIGINSTNTPPDASAMLDVSSTVKGVLIPRMTTLQKTNLPNKSEGLLVYDTDLKQFSYYKSFGAVTGLGYWQDFGNPPTLPGSVWNTNGNDIYNSNSGNVGIGTSSPLTKLHIEGTSIIADNTLIDPDTYPNKVIAGRIADGTGWESIGVGGKNGNSGQSWAIGSVNGDFSIAASNGTSDNSLQTGLILDTQRNLLLTPFGGNVAVGVNASKAKFEVTSPYTTTALFGSNSTGISLQQNWPTIGFNQYRDNANVQRYIGNGFAMGNFVDPTSGSMYWNAIPNGTTNNPTPSETTIMALKNNGNLGVGVVDPLAKFHIKYLEPGYGAGAGFSPYGIAGFESNIDAFINLMCPKAFQSGVLFGSTLGSTRGGIVYTNNNGGPYESLALRTGGNINRMVIDKNGNVAIGDFMPANKLDVNGTIRGKEVIVETGWADYVFENNYKLRSIDAMEQFIIENKHLPNIPKASEIEKNGLKIGETNKVMMEKIEELALYIIQLKKEIDLLKTKN